MLHDIIFSLNPRLLSSVFLDFCVSAAHTCIKTFPILFFLSFYSEMSLTVLSRLVWKSWAQVILLHHQPPEYEIVSACHYTWPLSVLFNFVHFYVTHKPLRDLGKVFHFHLMRKHTN